MTTMVDGAENRSQVIKWLFKVHHQEASSVSSHKRCLEVSQVSSSAV